MTPSLRSTARLILGLYLVTLSFQAMGTPLPVFNATTAYATPVCGDTVCEAGEDLATCPQDCAVCNDGICDAGAEVYANCPADCYCGNGSCDDDESTMNCVADCGSLCGDDVTNGSEECDDGNNTNGDGCEADCTNPFCQNGIIDSGEQCDDGNYTNADFCESDCTYPICQNGIVDSGEECDEGMSTATCDADCTYVSCGDGTLNIASGEQCDASGESNTCDDDCTTISCGDYNVNETAGEQCDTGGESPTCNSDCTNAVCGDYKVNAAFGEQCDTGVQSPTCDDDCTYPSCGDGNVNETLGEQCDASGESNACDDDCTYPSCGDGNVNESAGEQCDTNGDNGSCDYDCTLPVCGDGHVNAYVGEQCDDGNTTDADGCEANCTSPVCQNGIVDSGEQCDDGNNTNGDACENDCTSPVCQNGILDSGEQCDDGNNMDGDACETNCTTPVCQNGILDSGEECDDGNNTDGDSCEADCTNPICQNNIVDGGEDCDTGAETVMCDDDCTIVSCGDGNVNESAGEACDDSGESAGCNADCTITSCGDNIVNTTAGEQCDDGNQSDGDGCSATCQTELHASGGFSGHTYVFHNSALTYADAVAACSNAGGYLANITNDEENAAVYDLAGGSEVWIGLSDAVPNSITNFQWTSGDPLSYTNWNAGEPNDGGNNVENGEEDCVEMFTDGTWNDYSCGSLRSYVCEFDDSLVGHWRFDEGGGTVAIDSSMFSNNGELVSGMSYLDSIPSIGESNLYSLNFGADQHVTVPSFDELPSGNQPRTVSLWFRPDDLTTQANTALFFYGSETAEAAFYVLLQNVSGSKSVCLGHWGGGDAPCGSGLEAGSWYNVVLTFNGSAATMYLNGVSIGSVNRTFATDQTPIFIGDVPTGGAQFIGLIDDVRLWNRALSPEEAAAIRGIVPSSPGIPDLIADVDTGSSTTDNLTNSTTLTFDITCEDGDDVSLLEANTVIATEVCVSGTVRISIEAAVGPHTVSAVQTNAQNRTSDPSDSITVVVDTYINPTSHPDLQAASDNGSSTTDNLTNSTTLAFDFSCEDDAMVELLENGVVQTFDTCSSSIVTLTVSGVTDGSHTYTARQTDVAGNVSTESAGLTVIVDTSGSAPGAPDLNSTYDSGISNADDTTNYNSLAFDISCENGATVELLESSSVITSVVCESDSVQLNVSGLPDGQYTYTARQTDAAGNVSAESPSLTVTVDTVWTAPGTPDLNASYDSGVSNTDDVTNATTLTFDVSCDNGATVELLENSSLLTSGVCASNTVQFTIVSVADGAHTYTARQTDLAGNASIESSGLTVTVDTSGTAPGTPDLNASYDSGALDTDDVTNITTLVFDIACDNGATVEILGDGNLITSGVCSSSTVQLTTIGITEGLHVFTARQTDEANNLSAESAGLNVTVDVTGPSLAEVTSVPTPDTNRTPQYMFSSTEDGAISYGGSCDSDTLAAGTGNNTILFNELAFGTHSDCTITVTDTAGNESNLAISEFVIIDTSAPDLLDSSDTGFSSTDNITSDLSPTFSTHCTDGATVELLEEGSPLVSGLCSGTSIELTVTGLGELNHHIYSHEDTGEGFGIESDVLNYTIDATAPAATGTPDLTTGSDTGTSSTDNITSDATPTLTISCTDTNRVTLKDGGTAVGSGTCGSSTVTITASALSETVHTLTATQTDLAGNESTASLSLLVTIDATAPAATGTPDLMAASDTGLSQTDNVTSDRTPTVAVSCADGEVVMLKDGSTAVGTGTCSSSTVEITASSLTEGSHTLTAMQTDAAGNASVTSSALSIVLDSTAPAYLTGAAQGTTVTLTYNGSLAAAVPATTAYTVLQGSTPRTVTAVDVSGSIVTLTLSETITGATTVSYVVPGSAMVQDLAGNIAAPLDAVAVTVTVASSSNASSSSSDQDNGGGGGGGGSRRVPATAIRGGVYVPSLDMDRAVAPLEFTASNSASSPLPEATVSTVDAPAMPAADAGQEVLAPLPEPAPELRDYCQSHAILPLRGWLSVGNMFYGDISRDSWFADPAYELARAGVMTGLKDQNGVALGLFDPAREATQAEILRVVMAARGSLVQPDTGDRWFQPYLDEAKRLGLTIADHFEAARPATRSQVVSLIAEMFCQTETIDIPPLTFTDVSPERPEAGVFAILAQKLVILGDDNAFTIARPDDSISRAELAAMIIRAVEQLAS